MKRSALDFRAACLSGVLAGAIAYSCIKLYDETARSWREGPFPPMVELAHSYTGWVLLVSFLVAHIVVVYMLVSCVRPAKSQAQSGGIRAALVLVCAVILAAADLPAQVMRRGVIHVFGPGPHPDLQLIGAAADGDAASVRYIISDETEIKLQGDTMIRAMVIAVRRGRDEIVSMLLREGISPDARYGETSKTLLMHAVETNHEGVAGILLGAGANPALTDEHGDTARRIAEQLGYRSLCAMIDRRSRA